MFITDDTANAMLDTALPSGSGNVLLSLHSAYSASGGNLIGDKTEANFAAASSRTKALAANCDIAVPGGSSVAWVGAWDSGGTDFIGMTPNGGTIRSFQVDVGNDRILTEGHGLSNDDRCAFFGGTVPAGLTAGTLYHVVGVTAGDPDYFQVSTSQGGSPVNITGQPGLGCWVSKVVIEAYAAAGTHRISTFSVPL